MFSFTLQLKVREIAYNNLQEAYQTKTCNNKSPFILPNPKTTTRNLVKNCFYDGETLFKKEANCIYQHYKEQQIIGFKKFDDNYNNEDIIYDCSLPLSKKKEV